MTIMAAPAAGGKSQACIAWLLERLRPAWRVQQVPEAALIAPNRLLRGHLRRRLQQQASIGITIADFAEVCQALIAAGQPVSSTAIAGALAFLKSAQTADGGIVYDPRTPEFGADANSTAYAIQAIWAAGGDPAGEAWTVDGSTPLRFLLGLQLADGSFEWQADTGSSLLATAQAIPALLGHSYPTTVRALEPCAARRAHLDRTAAACASPAAGGTGGACATPAGANSETQP